MLESNQLNIQQPLVVHCKSLLLLLAGFWSKKAQLYRPWSTKNLNPTNFFKFCTHSLILLLQFVSISHQSTSTCPVFCLLYHHPPYLPWGPTTTPSPFHTHELLPLVLVVQKSMIVTSLHAIKKVITHRPCWKIFFQSTSQINSHKIMLLWARRYSSSSLWTHYGAHLISQILWSFWAIDWAPNNVHLLKL